MARGQDGSSWLDCRSPDAWPGTRGCPAREPWRGGGSPSLPGPGDGREGRRLCLPGQAGPSPALTWDPPQDPGGLQDLWASLTTRAGSFNKHVCSWAEAGDAACCRTSEPAFLCPQGGSHSVPPSLAYLCPTVASSGWGPDVRGQTPEGSARPPAAQVCVPEKRLAQGGTAAVLAANAFLPHSPLGSTGQHRAGTLPCLVSHHAAPGAWPAACCSPGPHGASQVLCHLLPLPSGPATCPSGHVLSPIPWGRSLLPGLPREAVSVSSCWPAAGASGTFHSAPVPLPGGHSPPCRGRSPAAPGKPPLPSWTSRVTQPPLPANADPGSPQEKVNSGRKSDWKVAEGA